MTELDCRNLPCPAPVLAVKKALETATETLTVLLDSGAPRENVKRFICNQGYTFEETEQANGWIVSIYMDNSVTRKQSAPENDNQKIILVSSDSLGNGSEELGRLLMKNFINTLVESINLPSKIIFINSGVKLTCEGSDVIEALEKLIGMGVEVFSCGLCLDYFSIKDRLKAGSTTNMFSVVETILTSNLVINLP